VVQQVKKIMAATPGKASLDDFTNLAFQAWTLWAQSATQCGTNLTQDCVLQRPATAPAGMPAAFLLRSPNHSRMRRSRMLDHGTTHQERVGLRQGRDPAQQGPFNCGSDNLVTVKSYLGN